MTLLEHVERFIAITGMRASMFGREAVNDPAFVANLRNGSVPRAETARTVRNYMISATVEALDMASRLNALDFDALTLGDRE